MSISKTNESPIYVAEEDTPGVLPVAPRWINQPFISIDAGTGGTYQNAEDDTINADRQPQGAQLVSVAASAGYNVAATMDTFYRYTPALLFNEPVRLKIQDIKCNAVSASNDEYTLVTGLTAQQAALIKENTLIEVSGSIHSANNGLQVVDADASSGDTEIGVSAMLTDESPSVINISAVGARKPSGTSSSWDYDQASNTATLSWTGHSLDTDHGLQVGSVVHFGSPNGMGGFTNAMEGTAANDTYGSAMVRAISDNAIVFDNPSTTLRVDSAAATTSLDLLFGVRNVVRGTLDTGFKQRTFSLLQLFANLDGPGVHKHQVTDGLLLDSMNIAVANRALGSMQMAFQGEEATPNLTTAMVQAAPYLFTVANRSNPIFTTRFNNSINIGRITTVEGSGTDLGYGEFLTTYNLNFGNGVNSEGAVGTLANAAVNPGRFFANLTATAFFINDRVISSVRSQAPVWFGYTVTNLEGFLSIDMPSMVFTGADIQYETDSTMKLALTGSANKNNFYQQTVFVNTIAKGGLSS